MLTEAEIAKAMKEDPYHWAYVYLKALELIEQLTPKFTTKNNENN